MTPTDIRNPNYFHKVVDCQYACPAHTNVPEYIRLIAQGRYADAYFENRKSNVFPGILGRTCDRPCEPACRRGRIEEKPVAICRLKRVAADHKGDFAEIADRFPKAPAQKNGKRVALVGAGPASLTVANDLMPLGYSVTIFEKQHKPGGLMRSNIPSFRLPEQVLEEECGVILDMGVDIRYSSPVTSMKGLLDQGFDAIFVGSGAPRGKDLDLPGRWEAGAKDNIHIGIDWLESVAFGHTSKIGKRVLIIGVGNTAMDCCRTSKRLGGEDVKVMARRPREYFKASPWELEDAEEEHIEIVVNHAPKRFVVENGKLVGMEFERVEWDKGAKNSKTIDTVILPCDDVILAIGQDASFPWIERDLGIEFNKWEMPVVNEQTFMCSRPGIFFGGDAAWGPKNIIWAVAHGHDAANSIDLYCHGKDVAKDRAPQNLKLTSMKMGISEWSFSNDYDAVTRQKMKHVDLAKRFDNMVTEVELGFTAEQFGREVERCLNCDMQTVFEAKRCIECDACIDICPVQCLTITANGAEEDLRARLSAPAVNLTQDLYVSADLPQTKRAMVKDEDVCVHCGLCAERCPTAAWDMQQFQLILPQAGSGTLAPAPALTTA